MQKLLLSSGFIISQFLFPERFRDCTFVMYLHNPPLRDIHHLKLAQILSPNWVELEEKKTGQQKVTEKEDSA
jgi:hypothetical protein